MSETGSVKGFIDFDDLVKRNLKGYSERLEKLFNVCSENKDVRHIIPFEEAVSRLISGCQSTLRDLEIEGNVIKEFVIGKSFVKQKIGVRFRPDKRTTWSLGGGINGRWRMYNDSGYDGLVVLGCIEKELIPKDIREKVNFDYIEFEEGGNDQIRQHFEVDQQLYALALEQRLIQHFIFNEKDHRIRNHSLDCGMKTKTPYKGGIVYLAYRLEDTKNQNTYFEERIEDEEETKCRSIHEYVVSLDDKHHLIKVSSSEMSCLKDIVRSTFGLPNDKEFDIQCMKFDVWANVSLDDIPKDGKLKVILREDHPKLSEKSKKPKPQTELYSRHKSEGTGPKQTVTFLGSTNTIDSTCEKPLLASSTSPITHSQQIKVADLMIGYISKTICVQVLESTTKDCQRVLKDDTGRISASIISERVEQCLVPGKVYEISNFSVIKCEDHGKKILLGMHTTYEEVKTAVKRMLPDDTTEASPSKQPVRAQPKMWIKKDKEEKKIILEEVLKYPGKVNQSVYEEIVLRVIARKEEFQPKVKEYYCKMLETDQGKNTIRKRILSMVKANPSDLMATEKDPEIIKLLNSIFQKNR